MHCEIEKKRKICFPKLASKISIYLPASKYGLSQAGGKVVNSILHVDSGWRLCSRVTEHYRSALNLGYLGIINIIFKKNSAK